MKIINTALTMLLLKLMLSSCSGHQSTARVELDTAKLAIANADNELTTLRLMTGSRLKPNGYFFGAAGVSPNGEVSTDSIRADPAYTNNGISVYYRYLVDGDIKTDTFHVDFGPKNSMH